MSHQARSTKRGGGLLSAVLRRAVVAFVVAMALLALSAPGVRGEPTEAEKDNTLRFLQNFGQWYSVLKPGWTGDDYCTWTGVKCEGDDVRVDVAGFGLVGMMPGVGKKVDATQVRVTEIDMSRNPGISGDFVGAWGQLKHLRVLNLSNTRLRGSLPKDWTYMEALEKLDVHNTVACHDLPDWYLPNLKEVDLSSCGFRGSLHKRWAQMTTLETVDLSGNRFCGCVPSEWYANPALKAAVDPSSGINNGVNENMCSLTNMCSLIDLCVNRNAASGANTGGSETLQFLQGFSKEFKVLRASWLGTDYCEFKGVTCEDDGRVTVDLSGFGLVGDLPDVPRGVDGSLIKITTLDVSENPRLHGTFPSSWSKLTQLQKLVLSRTALWGKIPDSWKALSSLSEVNISNTAACLGLPEWDATSMPNLQSVDFSNNNMAGSLESRWSTFELEYLDLSGNRFCGCVPKTWSRAQMQSLAGSWVANPVTCTLLNWCNPLDLVCSIVPNKSENTGNGASGKDALSDTLLFLRRLAESLNLDWSGTDMCAFDGVECFEEDMGDRDKDNATVLTQMVNVTLANRGLSGSLPGIAFNLNGARVNVASLDLSGNAGIKGRFPLTWGYLRQLRELDLSGTGIRGDIPDTWDGMTSLEKVKITNTRACRSMPNWRASKMPKLTHVDFSNNPNMRGVMTRRFGDFTTLEEVKLTGTPFCGCVPDAWKNVPALRDATLASGTYNRNCLTNLCTGLDFVCPLTQVTSSILPSMDSTLAALRRMANSLIQVVDDIIHVEAGAPGVSRATLPGGQTLAQNWTGDDYCDNWAGVSCDKDTGRITLNLSNSGLKGALPNLNGIDGEDMSLVSIDFSGNPKITGSLPASWGELAALETLRLVDIGVSSAIPKEWDGMISLRELVVSGTDVCGELPAWDVSKMPNLQTVDLSNNNLGGTLPESWGELSSAALSTLDLSGNEAMCGCLPASWTSVTLVDGARSAKEDLVSSECEDSPVQCSGSSTCAAKKDPAKEGVVGAVAPAVAAWATAVVAAVALAL